MSWRMDSTAGAALWDTMPLSASDLECRDEEIRWLMGQERQRWGLINGRLKEKAEPTAYGTYAGIAANPPPGTLANVATISGEMSPWDVPSYTPWLAKSLAAPSAWELYVSWQLITSTSPASVTINPRVGSIASGASSAGGSAMGAGSATTLTASITTNWNVNGKITVRSTGVPGGANSKAMGTFNTVAKPASAGTGIPTIWDFYGYTEATFDWGAASGVTLGMAHTVTTINYSILQIHWLSMF
jgi:hypothetical protein